jgi:hypothetical protein
MKVNISGTISKDKRADSGLDAIGDAIYADRLRRYAVTGIVEFHAFHDVDGVESVTVRFAAIEPLSGEDDNAARLLLDKARRARGVGSTELTLFDAPDADSKGPWPGDPDYVAPGTTGQTGAAVDELEPRAEDQGDDADGDQGQADAEPELRPDADPADDQGAAESPAEAPKAKRAPRKRALTSVPEPAFSS